MRDIRKKDNVNVKKMTESKAFKRAFQAEIYNLEIEDILFELGIKARENHVGKNEK